MCFSMTKEKYEKGEKREPPKKDTWEALKEEGNKYYSHKKYEQGNYPQQGKRG